MGLFQWIIGSSIVGTSGGGGGGGASVIPSLGSFATYAALNTAYPASPALIGKVAYVQASSGVYLINRKNKGWYECDGANWIAWEGDDLAMDEITKHVTDYDHASIADKIQKIENVVIVQTNPGPGQYSTITAAMASITTNSSTNPFVVLVGPGVYVEDTITTKPYVNIIGHGAERTILQVDSTAKDVIHIADNNVVIQGMTISGASDSGKAGISYTGTVAATSIYLDSLRFKSNDIHLLNAPNGVAVTITVHNSTIAAGTFTNGFVSQQTGGGQSTIFLKNCSFLVTGAITSLAIADGANTNILATGTNFRSVSTGNCLTAQDGGRLQIVGISVMGWTKGIYMPNTGASTSIIGHGINFDSNTLDVDVQHTSATGTIEGPIDITKVSINQSCSVFLPYKDSHIIRVAKKGGDFTSFGAALAYITDNSTTHRYIIDGGPGTFVEDTLTMKPYVYLRGQGNETTIIQVDTTTKKVVIGADHSGILSCGITGATGVGGIGVYHEGSGTFTPFLVRDCYFMSNETNAQAHGAAAVTILQIDNCRTGGTTNFTNGFICTNVSSIATQLVISNTIHQDVINPGCTIYAKAVGAGTGLVIDNVLARNYPSAGSTFVSVEDGAEVRMLSVSIRGFGKSIHAINTGAAPKIYAQGININESVTDDILIEHTGTVGNYFGTYDVQKISIATGSTFYIANKDLNIVTVAIRGGDFTSIAAACDFITDADPDTNPYLILVGPGTFSEPEINLKPGISVRGSSIQSTTVNPDANNHNIFNIERTCELSFMSISGAGSGYIGVMCDDVGDFAQLHKVSMYDNDTHIKIRSVTQDTYLYLEYVDINGVYVNGLYVESTNGFVAYTNAENWYTFNGVANAGNDIFATGTAAVVHVQASILLGITTNTGVRLENGAKFKGASCKIEDADIAVYLPNIGAGQILECYGLQTTGSVTNNFKIDHPSATGFVAGSADITQLSVNASSTVKFNVVDNDSASSIGLTVIGDIYQGGTVGTIKNVSEMARESVTAGIVDSTNGLLSQGTNPLDVDVAAGKAYVIDNLDEEHIHTWTSTTITVPDNSKYYVTVNAAGTLQLESSLPIDPEQRAVLGYVVSLGGVLIAISNSYERADHAANHLSLKDRNINGSQFASGSLVSENVGTPYALDVSAGEYWYGARQFLPTGITAGNFRLLYQDGVGGTTLGSVVALVPDALYDDGSGTLAAVPAGEFVKHALALVGDGPEEQYIFIYGQSTHASLVLAQAATLPVLPSFIEESITVIANIITQEGAANIAEIGDERRLSGVGGSGATVITDHGSLTGLADNDHPQYLLRNGTNAMTADLDMGGFTLTNIGSALPGTTTAAPVSQTPDQANDEGVSSHKARADHVHNIPTATPVTIGTSNQQGVAASFAKSDHVHNHGNLGGGSTHSAVTTSVNGFMSAADKTKLDLVTSVELGYVAGVTSAIQTQLNGKAASGANTDITSVLLNQTGLAVKGATAFALVIKPDETLTANRTLSIIVGNADRSLTLTGTASISGTHTGTSSGNNTGDQTISLTGDVTGSGTGSFAATIGAGVVTNAKLATVATATFKGRTTAGTGAPEDLSVAQATALLNVMVGDAGSGGTKGLVPAPASGDAAKFLRGDGTWVANASGTVTTVSVVTANGFAGTVATDSTTPAITLTTSVTGILQGNGTAISAASTTGSGAVVLATSPTLTTPVLGVASATSINKVAITAPATSATLTIADGKTFTVSNTLTFTGTDTSSVAFGTGGTVAYQGGTLAQFASTTSAQLAALMSDETGSGALVFATSPSLVTPTLGVASATSINKVAITAPTTSATLTIADGKTATFSNTLTFTGTDTSSVAFGAGGAVAYTDKANVFGDFDQSFRSTRLRIANPANTQYYTFTSSAITANRAITIPLLSQDETLAIQGQLVQSTPANPTGTASATGVMMGLAIAFTPRVTGRIRIHIDGTYTCANAGSEVTVTVRTGTGGAPANGAALTGTVTGNSPIYDGTNGNETLPFSLTRTVVSLTLGTAIWIDLGLTRGGTNNTVSVQTLNIVVQEV